MNHAALPAPIEPEVRRLPPPRRPGRLAAWFALAAAACIVAPPAVAATFAQRLDAVLAAADRHLAQNADDSRAYPSEWRRIAWLRLAGDREADALLVLKPGRDECAVAADTSRPCKALILTAAADGSYAVAVEFPMYVHPLVFHRTAAGIDAMYYTRDKGAAPAYARYAVRDNAFVKEADGATLESLQSLDAFITDDRNLPLVTDQRYAANEFDNDRAKLAPYRLQLDGVNVADRRKAKVVYDSAFDERAKLLYTALAPDAARITAQIGWNQTLDLRLWSCIGWMVPRRFWEVENRRLGKVGMCIDPVVFGLKQGLLRNSAEYVAAARYRMLQEIGVAYVLRVAPLSNTVRTQLKQEDAVEALVRSGATAGALIGVELKLQTLEQASAAQSLWRKLSQGWFEQYERGERLFVSRSPELRAFDTDLDSAEAALRCLSKPSVSPGCTKDTLARIELLRASLRNAIAQ